MRIEPVLSARDAFSSPPEPPVVRLVARRWAWFLMPPAGRAASALWWLHPVSLVVVVGLVYATFPMFDFLRFVPHAYIPGWHYAWGALLLAALAVGAALAAHTAKAAAAATGSGRPGGESMPLAIDLPRGAMAALLVATLMAYAVWFEPLIAQPGLLLEILTGQRGSVRGAVTTTPGLTTMTQFGVAYAIAHAVLRGGRARPMAGWEHLGLALVLALATLRAFAWSERLAVIEIVLAWCVARLAFGRIGAGSGPGAGSAAGRAAGTGAGAGSGRAWRAASVAPLVAPVVLYLAFTGTEYFRSWEYFRDEYDSVWAFSFERLLAYYATASNNGAGWLHETSGWPLLNGRYVAEWLYLMPGLGDGLRADFGDARLDYERFLEQFARPELNNATGIFPIVFDLGYAGSMVYFALAGLVAGRLYEAWRCRTAAGVLGYPVMVLFVTELLRFNYLASTRGFPVLLALVALWLLARPAWPRHLLQPRWVS